jgi:hypothetical protein
MNAPPIARSDNERGMVMLIVLVTMTAVSLLGLASLLVVAGDLRISGNYRNSAQAFWAAEAGLQRSLNELRDDRTFVGLLPPESFANKSNSSAEVTVLSGALSRVVAVGHCGSATRRLEAIVNTDTSFGAAINVGGDLTLSGKPRISAEGVRLNGNAQLDLDSGTPDLNLYMPAGATLDAIGNTSAIHRVDKEPMDLAAIRLRDNEWVELSQAAAPAARYDTDSVFGNRNSSATFVNLNFDNIPSGPDGNKAIFVDGDVTLNGEISGIGAVIATGKIICTGGFVSHGATVTMVAKDDVLINFDTNAQSDINGLVYSEGDYELHGKVKFVGVVTAFGSVNVQNPSEFTNNSDPNFWYTYSPAYNIIADPVDILSWSELDQ